MNYESIEIDFNELIQSIKKNIQIVLIIPLLVLGSLYIYLESQPKTFHSITKILPEVGQKPNNGLSGLYSLTKEIGTGGRDLYNMEITSPQLYGEILNSRDLYNFLKTKKTNFELSFNEFQKKIIVVARKNHTTKIETIGNSPEEAIELNKLAVNYLTNFIKDYRTQKAKEDLAFFESFKKGNREFESEMIDKQILLIQDHTPSFTFIDSYSVSEYGKHKFSLYFTVFSILLFIILIFILVKDKNYTRVFKKLYINEA